MRQEDINELLSAYLDGESEDPEAVDRLLEQDAGVRRRFEIMKSHSEALRALTPPDVAPGFATRVLGGVREERQKRHHRWMPLVTPLAAVVAVVVVVGLVYFAMQTPFRPSSPPGSAPMANNDTRALREMDPETLDSILAQEFAAHPGAMDELEDGYESVGNDRGDMTALLALDQMADVMAENVELEVLLEELNPDEKAVLRELLIEYALEG